MKLYIKNYSSYRSDKEDINIKKELKEKYGLDTRRQDDFIHLAVYGAQRLKENTTIQPDDELYVTTGVGDIGVVQRTNTHVNKDNLSVKLFDFINLLGNSTSYYVAKSLDISGKNIFQISDNFTYINTLVSLYASITNSKKDAILCAIDLVNTPDEVIKRVLGMARDLEVISSVNYQKFSLDNRNAVAVLEFESKSYTLDEVKEILISNHKPVKASMRCKKLELEKNSKMFETAASFALNDAMKKNEDLMYIDCFENHYKILQLKSLR
ncbi:MAG: hypothetical protein P794_09340 [Epsilonproteobacteria bacterium (ex Lamellibrachia satsuma)]|nr:MAG: hypothetical protein P794_09340 [Epsilonproteobacteria bacterium (ex Lamellibrachia satsuma)]